MRLHLIRHGETDSNVALALDTAHPGAPLNATGRTQAEALAQRYLDVPLDAVVTSDITRAIETGQPLATSQGITPETTPDWRELQAGELEMTTDEPSFRRFEEVVLAWYRGDLERSMPGGENGRETMARLDRGVELACSRVGEHGQVAIVGHGAATRMWVALRVVPLGEEVGTMPNTAAFVVEGEPGGWQLVHGL